MFVFGVQKMVFKCKVEDIEFDFCVDELDVKREVFVCLCLLILVNVDGFGQCIVVLISGGDV